MIKKLIHLNHTSMKFYSQIDTNSQGLKSKIVCFMDILIILFFPLFLPKTLDSSNLSQWFLSVLVFILEKHQQVSLWRGLLNFLLIKQIFELCFCANISHFGLSQCSILMGFTMVTIEWMSLTKISIDITK